MGSKVTTISKLKIRLVDMANHMRKKAKEELEMTKGRRDHIKELWWYQRDMVAEHQN